MKVLNVTAKCELEPWTPALAEKLAEGVSLWRWWREQLEQMVNPGAKFLLERLKTRAVFSLAPEIDIISPNQLEKLWGGYHMDYCGYDPAGQIGFFWFEGDNTHTMPVEGGGGEEASDVLDNERSLTAFLTAPDETPEKEQLEEILEAAEQIFKELGRPSFLLVNFSGESVAQAVLVVPDDEGDWRPFDENMMLTLEAQRALLEARMAHQTPAG